MKHLKRLAVGVGAVAAVSALMALISWGGERLALAILVLIILGWAYFVGYLILGAER